MTRVPIRLQVAVAFALAMALVLAGTSWFLYDRLDSHLRTALDQNLNVRAQDLAALVRQPGAPLSSDAGGRLVEPGESYAQLVDTRGNVLEATPPLGGASLLTRSELRAALTKTIYADRSSVPGLDEPSRMLATPIGRPTGRVVLLVGVTRMDRVETLGSLRDELLIAGPIALLLATIAGYVLAGFALRPVESMRRRAAEISADRPGERLPVPDTGDELERLAETLNEMLARLEVALERERAFVADAGHELRTPLALLRTELELALRHANTAEELQEAVRASTEEVDRLTQLAQDLLLIAGSDRGNLPLRVEDLDAATLLRTVARRYEWRAHQAGRPIVVETPQRVTLRADRMRMEQALGNLVDNALRHAAGNVRLSAARVNGTVELHVADEGAGLPPDFLDKAFDRFSRADGVRRTAGSGLGLSIVDVVARAHGGSAHIANTNGGADVWITVPDAPT